MTRTVDSILGAAMVLGAILLSPYAMHVKGGCAKNSQNQQHEQTSTPPETAATTPEPVVIPAPEQPASQPDATANPPDDPLAIRCIVPKVTIPRSAPCDGDEAYPACKWSLPDPAEANDGYETWRYSTRASRWGRPALVTLVLATASEYARLTGGEKLTVGDLDASQDRHKTHDRGVDVDLYLPGRMATENKGKGVTTDNYAGASPSFVAKSRGRVGLLAQILATCSSGKLRIYYNDPPVIDSFLEWFGDKAMTTPFDKAMKPHNALHLFHFHVTIADDLEVLAFEQ